jgi:hypothetical protein
MIFCVREFKLLKPFSLVFCAQPNLYVVKLPCDCCQIDFKFFVQLQHLFEFFLLLNKLVLELLILLKKQ